jgi:hypothetical protein
VLVIFFVKKIRFIHKAGDAGPIAVLKEFWEEQDAQFDGVYTSNSLNIVSFSMCTSKASKASVFVLIKQAKWEEQDAQLDVGHAGIPEIVPYRFSSPFAYLLV